MSLVFKRAGLHSNAPLLSLFIIIVCAFSAAKPAHGDSAENHAPVLDAIGPRSVSESQTLSLSVSALDVDNDSLVFNATSLPEGAVFQGGRFRWTPQKDQEGSHRVTFSVSDGQMYDSENVMITVYTDDIEPPVVSLTQPADAAIQVPINTLVALGFEDTGVGVDEASIRITLNGHTVYTGTTDSYMSHLGNCYRSGSRMAYRYVYQPADPFSFDQQVTVTAQASDMSGNSLPLQRFSFTTAMRSFGKNIRISGSAEGTAAARGAVDSQGRIWSVWHQGLPGQRKVMMSCWDPALETVNLVDALASTGYDRCCPVLVIDEQGMTLAWQEKREGQWDIYVSSSSDGQVWSGALRVSNPDGNQTSPTLALDSDGKVYLVWVDDQHGNADIYLSSSVNGFVNQATTRITYEEADQSEPDLAVGPQGRLYLSWTDRRKGDADIYGTHSDLRWAHVSLVSHPAEQREAALVVSPRDGRVHCVWTDNRQGHRDIYYGSMAAFSANGLTGIIVNDDGGDAEQSTPQLALGQDPRGGENVFVSWVDDRYREDSGDADIFYAEVRADSVSTNVLVGDDGTNSQQSQPDLLIDGYGQPVLLWSDTREEVSGIYGAGITHGSSTALYQGKVSAAAGGRLGTDPGRIGDEDDVSVDLPPGAYGYDITYTVAPIQNFPYFDSDCVSGYEIGPSGLQFHHPVTVTVPYQRRSVSGPPVPYWYDEQTGGLSQTGISEVVYWHVSNELGVLQFKTTHLTSYYVLDSEGGQTSSGAAGGGCVLVPASGRFSDFLVPAWVMVLILAWIRWHDCERGRSIAP